MKRGQPDKPDNCCQTPLSFTAEHEQAEVVKALLRQGEVSPTCRGVVAEYHFSSAEDRYEEVAKKLLR